MKTAQDKDGNEIQVPINTPCHPGVNGGLPRPYDSVVDAGILAEMAAKENAYQALAPERAKHKIKNKIIIILIIGSPIKFGKNLVFHLPSPSQKKNQAD